MKGKVILRTLLLALALTACGQSGEVLPEDPLPEPETHGSEEHEEGLRKPRRIMYEEALEYTNREENNNGFLLEEREEDGAPFLEFTRPEVPDFSLRINQNLTEAIVEYQGRTMTLERAETPNGSLYDWYVSAGYGGLVSGYSMPFWVDLTGDGRPELTWLRGGGGTGVYKNTCTIYDISGEGEIIPLIEPWEEMAASITVEPQGYEDGCVRSLVTDQEGSAYTAWLPVSEGPEEPEEVWRKCCYWPGESSHTYLEIDQERGVLTARMRFGLEGAYQMTGYIGELCTTLAYDADQGVITRSGPVSVSVYDKPES